MSRLGAGLPPASCLPPAAGFASLSHGVSVLLEAQMPLEIANCLPLSVKDFLLGENLSDVPEEEAF